MALLKYHITQHGNSLFKYNLQSVTMDTCALWLVTMRTGVACVTESYNTTVIAWVIYTLVLHNSGTSANAITIIWHTKCTKVVQVAQ